MDTSGHTGWSEEYTEITEGIFRIKVLRGSAKGAEQLTSFGVMSAQADMSV